MKHMYRPLRNSGCRIVDDIVCKGSRSLLLENEKLLIHLLLDRGGEPIRWLVVPPLGSVSSWLELKVCHPEI
ncbi:hypothetical protein [Paenibacillus sp. RC67]|uniref:hypothetical protein n=1 Tax=Paenibacillus sp. RC67 TaxID=3039392 RepID=UPI0024AD89B6|nr:hypothetical protein [Paenibacillus sp. RC67]